MNTSYKMYCRTFQTGFRAALPFLPYREPEIVGSCADLKQVFEKENITSVLVVTDRGIVSAGLVTPLEQVLTGSNIPFSLYADTLPKPTVQNVEDTLRLGSLRQMRVQKASQAGHRSRCGHRRGYSQGRRGEVH